MDEVGKDAQGRKPDSEGHILYDWSECKWVCGFFQGWGLCSGINSDEHTKIIYRASFII